MDKKHRFAAAAMTLIFGVAAYCFFAFRYPYHIHFQEQYQLFEWTWEYFAGVAAVPGGLSDWLGRLLTQFFYYAPAGALIMALLLCAVQLGCFAFCRRKDLAFYALSFLPAAAMWCFHCDENALAGASVALAGSLFVGAGALSVKRDGIRHALEIILVPVLYMAAGSLAAVFVIGVAAFELAENPRRGWVPAAAMLVLAALCPVIASRIFPYTLERLLSGVHYYRYHAGVPAMPWIALTLAAAVSLAGALIRTSREARLVPAVCIFAACAVLTGLGVSRFCDSTKEEWMKYDFMVRMQMWNRLMYAADEKNPDSPMTVSALNLALAKSGRMPDSQFEYFQNGPEGLFPTYERSFVTPIPTSEVFWHLGMVNSAQRYTFEAQEAIPDFQKSARCYKRLAETNIVNGDWDVARKYLRTLTRTTFYSKWAREVLGYLDDGNVFGKMPELAAVKALRFSEHDFLFSDTEMDSMLGMLNLEHPQNTMALDCLMSLCLLKKDLDRFVQCISLVQKSPMPKSYQEALLLRWVQTHSDFEGLPTYISRAYAKKMNDFLSDGNSGKDEAYMQSKWGDTYWFYYYYRYKAE